MYVFKCIGVSTPNSHVVQGPTVYTVEYYSHKKNKILPFATWMDLEGIMLNEINHIEKDKYCIISITCGSKTKTKTLTHR